MITLIADMTVKIDTLIFSVIYIIIMKEKMVKETIKKNRTAFSYYVMEKQQCFLTESRNGFMETIILDKNRVEMKQNFGCRSEQNIKKNIDIYLTMGYNGINKIVK